MSGRGDCSGLFGAAAGGLRHQRAAGRGRGWSLRLEDLEVDAARLSSGWAQRFLVACGVGGPRIAKALREAHAIVARAGTAVIKVRVGQALAGRPGQPAADDHAADRGQSLVLPGQALVPLDLGALQALSDTATSVTRREQPLPDPRQPGLVTGTSVKTVIHVVVANHLRASRASGLDQFGIFPIDDRWLYEAKPDVASTHPAASEATQARDAGVTTLAVPVDLLVSLA
jgi:hypothetical protein